MDFLRRHVFYIVCGVAVASGLALGGLGLQGMPAVGEEMEKVKRLYNDLNSLSKSPVNKGRIEAEKKRIDEINEDRDRVFDNATSLYGYEPLIEKVFPAGENVARLKFRLAYTQAMDELFAKLQSGSPANATKIRLQKGRIDDERAEMRANGQDPDAITEPDFTAGGVLTVSGAKRNATARAHLAAAQRLRCYAVHFADTKPPTRYSSLDFPVAMQGTSATEELFLDELWWAQVGYWIQKDVIEAIVAINEEAAVEASREGLESSVGVMPVKDVLSIRLSEEYIPQDGDEFYGDRHGGFAPVLPPGTPETVFTHSGSNDWYEVVQYTVKLVMDQRDIPKLIDRLCKNKFHTLLRLSYEIVPPNRRMIGKIYGAEPTVNVLMDFETIMLGEVFREWMPSEICETYEIDCPDPNDEGDEDNDDG